MRAAQAEQAWHIAELDALRSSQIKLGRGDHSLSVIGELGMARNISPSAAGTQYGFAVGLARMPKVAAVFAGGQISEFAAKSIVNESTGLTAKQAAGDTRTRGQVMFDEFVLRGTGQKKVTDVNVEVGVIMKSGSLMRTEQTPAMLAGFGPIPAELAHNLIAAGKDVWIRRFFADEVDGSLVDCDQRRRRFQGKVRHLIPPSTACREVLPPPPRTGSAANREEEPPQNGA